MTPGQAQQLTSYLYGLKTPEAVQQFAAQHQNDINVVGLASGVANAMRSASQAQQQPTPQGTVTQQAIAQMAPRAPMPPQMPQQALQPQAAPQSQAAQQLPENSGIAQLPAQNMQSMAGGGITGFADGGMNNALDAVNQSMPDPSVDMAGFNKFGGSMSEYLAARQKALNAIQNNFTPPNPASNAAYQSVYGRAPAITNLPTNTASSVSTPSNNGVPTAMPDSAGIAQLPVRPGQDKNIVAGAQKAPPAAAPTAPAAPAGGLPTLVGGTQPQTLAQNAAAMNQAFPNPEDQHTMDLSEHVQQIKSQAAAMGVDVENSKAFAQLDKLDQKSQELLDKKQNLAMIQAGLGMIRSGNPFEAIAAGAGQGIKSYSEAMDQAQQTQQKLAESRMGLEASKNAMNAGLFGKALDNTESALKRNMDYLNSTKAAAVAQTDAQLGRGSAEAIAKLQSQTQYGVEAQRAASQERIWAGRSDTALQRANIMAAAKEHPSYEKMFANVAKTMPGATPDAIGLATTEQMMRQGMLGGSLIQNIPGGGAGKVLNAGS